MPRFPLAAYASRATFRPVGFPTRAPTSPRFLRPSRRNVRRQPLSMTVGNHPIVPALPDEDRHSNRGQVEAPRLDERHVVVEPAPVALAQRLAEDLGRPVGELAGQ